MVSASRPAHSRLRCKYRSGVPENSQLQPQLDRTDRAVIIGMGNVAIDCARILLSPIDELAKTDITDLAVDRLRHSRIRQVTLVGRRGPLQVSFTIKELRELTKLAGVQSQLDADDYRRIDQPMIDRMERPRKRLTELLMKTVRSSGCIHKPEEFHVRTTLFFV